MSDVIGVIGLGVMGSAMGSHIVNAGLRVVGFDIDPDRQAAFAGEALGSVTEVAAEADIILFSLPKASALEAVVEELTACARPGTVAVEMGTLPLADKMAAFEALAPAGVTLLDTPVSGTGFQAADGTLVVYSSGDKDAHDRVAPVFDAIGKKTYHLGEFGNGSRMKYVANHLVTIHTLAAAEAHLLGARSGLDPDQVQEVIGAGVGSSAMFEIRGPMMAKGVYEPPSAALTIILKDGGIIAEHARMIGTPTPLLDVSIPMYQAATDAGLGDLDAAALRRYLEMSD